MNNSKNSQPLYFKIVLGVSFAVIVLMLFALARSTYRDLFQVGSYIDTSSESIEQQKAELAEKPNELAYSESARYREKVAKELLGQKLVGEEVIILTNEEQAIDDFFANKVKTEKSVELLSPSQKWLRYLFGI
ncbi:MAG: hypothetical protein K9L85_03180 [Candidatus Peribacteraceae bacterium]|nr:hypothetical protein [Candidatus Peribacteraceae bacterium]